MTEAQLIAILDTSYREILETGERAARSHLPAVRDAWFGAAAILARASLAVGVKLSEPTHGP